MAAEDAAPPCPPVDPALAPLCACVRTLIGGVGEDAGREGLVDTPKRVAKAWLDMTAGYKADIDSILNGALFHEPCVGSAPGLAACVLVRDVEFSSTSERDLSPFYGRLHIAYVPGTSGVVLGLSKVARLAKVLARRLTHQAALADAVLAAFVGAVRPRGAAVLVEARAVGRAGAASAPGGPGLVVTTAAHGCCADGLGGGPSVTEVLSLLRLRGAAAGGTAPLPASASVGAPSGAARAQAATAPPPPLPPLPPANGDGSRGLGPAPHRPTSGGHANGGAAASKATAAAAAPSPLAAPGPTTPDRGPGASSSSGSGDDEHDDDGDPSRAYVHAGEVLRANGHGGGGGASLPRPPSAAAGLHLRGRGGGGCGGGGSAPAKGAGSASPPPPPASPPSTLEPCPARRGSVSAASRCAMVAAVTRMLSLAGDDPTRPGLRGSADAYVGGLLASTAGYDADVAGMVAGAVAARAAGRKEGAGGTGGPAAAQAAAGPPLPPAPPLPTLPPSHAPLLPPPCVDVAVRFTSMCEHHMLPFHGVARVVCLVDEEEGGEEGGKEGSGSGNGGEGDGGPRTPRTRRAALDPPTVAALVRAFALRLQVQERLTQQVTEAVHAAAGFPKKGTLVVIEAAHMCMVARGVEQHGSATVTVGARGGLAVEGAARRELLGRLAGG